MLFVSSTGNSNGGGNLAGPTCSVADLFMLWYLCVEYMPCNTPRKGNGLPRFITTMENLKP